LHGRVPFALAIFVVLVVALVAVHPPLVLFIAVISYVVVGLLLTLWQIRSRRIQRRRGGLGH
ncbi:MAG: CDP-diacylglycerol--serine O-phosphatidyltransferase, partial [Acidithiobacillus ferrivorans]